MPNRLLKESIRTSKSVNLLTDFQFRLWVHLITFADDYGRGSADPELIKGLCFPRRKGITEAQLRSALSDLANTGMIVLYEVDGDSFFYFPNWEKHQQVRAKVSRFPAPDGDMIAHDITCNHMISDDITCSRNTIQNPIQNTNTNTNIHSARAQGEKWVVLTDEERGVLISELGEAEFRRCLDYLESYCKGNHNKYGWTDWPHIVRRCSREKWGLKISAAKKSNVIHESDMGLTGGDDLERLARIFSKKGENA